MVDNNNTNFMSWLWETTNGTSVITAADTQTYYFGTYGDDIRITPPSPTQKLSEAYTNQYRYAQQFQGPSEFPDWNHKFHPVNCIPEMMFLGDPTDATPDTLKIKHSGLKHSFSSRWEYKGGTNPRRIQSVGNYAVNYNCWMLYDSPNLTELGIAWGKFENENDRVALTTAPIYPETIEEPYYGITEVKWDYGEAGVSDWSEVYGVDFSQSQQYTLSKPSKTTQNIYPGSYSPVDITFQLVMNQNEQSDALISREIVDVAVKTVKPSDATKYKQIVFKDVQINKIIDSGIAYDGKVVSYVSAKCPSFEVNFVHQGSNFSTYYPGYA